MGVLQSKCWVPHSVDFDRDIEDFYTRNRNFLLRTALRTQAAPDTPETQEFASKAAESGRFHNFTDDPENFAEYMRNCTEGMREYVSGVRNPWSTTAQRREAYDKFFNSTAARANHDHIIAHKRNSADTLRTLIPADVVQKFLDRVLDSIPPSSTTDPFTHLLAPQDAPPSRTLEASVDIVARTWGVNIRRKWSLYGWWYGYHRLEITAPETNSPPGTAWVAKNYQGPSLAIPVGVRDTVVLASSDAKVIHELTHAVQFTFAPFWLWPREIMEVPAMTIERRHNGEFPDSVVRRQAALAYADLTCTDGENFNNIFAEKGGYTGVGLVSAKMWQYMAMPRTYYTYALGMKYPHTRMDSQMVRSPHNLYAAVLDVVSDGDPTPTLSDKIDRYSDR